MSGWKAASKRLSRQASESCYERCVLRIRSSVAGQPPTGWTPRKGDPRGSGGAGDPGLLPNVRNDVEDLDLRRTARHADQASGGRFLTSGQHYVEFLMSVEAALPLGWQVSGLYRFGSCGSCLAEGPALDDHLSGTGSTPTKRGVGWAIG